MEKVINEERQNEVNELTLLSSFGKRCKIKYIMKFKRSGGIGYYFLIEFEDETVIKVSDMLTAGEATNNNNNKKIKWLGNSK